MREVGVVIVIVSCDKYWLRRGEICDLKSDWYDTIHVRSSDSYSPKTVIITIGSDRGNLSGQ